MAKTVVGLFDDMDEARQVVDELVQLGIRREDINIVRQGDKGEDAAGSSGTAIGAATGAAVGGVTGLVASLSALAVPGVGPILAAGPIIATLAGAGIGAAAGGLIG